MNAYSTGLRVVVASGTAAAIPSFQRAVEIDSNFAMAHAALGLAYSSHGESMLSAEHTTRAWQLRDRVSNPEKILHRLCLRPRSHGKPGKGLPNARAVASDLPLGRRTRMMPQSFLGGLSTHGTGRFERAIEASQQAIAADPDSVLPFASLAQSYFLTDRFSEAERTLARAAEHKLEAPDLLVIRYLIAVLTGTRNRWTGAAGLARGKRRAEHWMAHEEALALARSGRLQAARRSSNRAVDLALQEGEREAAASYRAARALWEALCGDVAEGRRNANAALELSNGRDVEYAAALALGFSGGSSRSDALADDLERRFPEDTFAKFTYVPVLRAVSAPNHGSSADTVEQLQIASRYELAANGLNFNHFYVGGLHAAYVRGEAFVAARQYAKAAAEFQKLLDHRGIAGADPIGALVHLQLGRVFALLRDKAQAKAAYGAFLTLWRDADPDIPILKRAKAEYAKL